MRLTVAALALALLAGACGGDDGGTTNAAAGEGGELTGDVTVSGSSTVEPISVAVAEQFSAENPGVNISVEGPGTGDGFELFCNGETDISDASRPIDLEEEAPICEENGIEFIELKVAIDGLSVITSPENTAITCLGFADLYALIGAESEGFESWADANALAEELGATHAPYPDMPLDITAPGEESGTYDSFAEIVLEDIAYEERKVSEDKSPIRPDYQASANDTVIVEGVSGSQTSLGWVGFAFAVQSEGVIKSLEIEDENGTCVAPNPDTIRSGEYPIARDLFIYVNKAKVEENPALAAYVDFYLSEAGLATVPAVGYVELDPSAIAETQSVWASRETGSREG